LINNDEYKVMGMAAYGDWKKAYNDVSALAPKLNGLEFKRKQWQIYSKYANNFWNVHLGESAYIKTLVDVYGKVDVAAAGQRVLDDLMVRWVKNIIKRTGKREIGAAGGVFLNVKSNKRIREDLDIDLFPFPHAGDGGLSVGSALYWNQIINPETKFERLQSAALGPEFRNEEIEKELRKYKEIRYEKVKNICKVVAELLKKGAIIGWFQERMEYGPRALGNRTILANPTKVEYRDKVNSDVKFREDWRPFCPSMLYEAREEYLAKATDSPFMIMSFDVPKNKVKEIEAVVHVDGTTRPQLVRKEVYNRYWTLIKEVENEIGVPVVLNTSFNRKGEPIVCTPTDAMNTFLGSGMEYLAIGDYIVEKKPTRKK
jgi:carbamoyltransferase